MNKKKHPGKKQKKAVRLSATEAGLAFKHGFFLETAWILSMMFERKAKSLLNKIENLHPPQNYTFEQTIKRIIYHHHTGRVPQLMEHLELELLNELRRWKNSRNTLFKDMVNVHVSMKRMERLSSEGISLYKKWNKSLKLVKTEMKNSGNLTR